MHSGHHHSTFNIQHSTFLVSRCAMSDIRTYFADYAAFHQTTGNRACHKIGIPLIMLSLLGMLARVTLVGRFDAAMLLVIVAEIVYLTLEWRLALAMLLVSAAFYIAGAAMPFWVNVALFVLGWIFQFVGHSVYEHKQPAFLRNF